MTPKQHRAAIYAYLSSIGLAVQGKQQGELSKLLKKLSSRSICPVLPPIEPLLCSNCQAAMTDVFIEEE